MAMRRWFARTYHQPPNSPLFDAETLAYWVSHMMADQEAEAEQLRSAIDASRSRSDPAAVAWRGRANARLAQLGGTVDEQDESLEADIEAARRGDLPDFMKKRIGRTRG